MKRDIKFRTWNGEKVYVVDIFTLGHEIWPLMQYTGLKDKNGVEIYEGDVVRWGDHCNYCRERPVRVAEVKMRPDLYFASQVGDFHYGSFIYTAKNGSNELEHLEVIGNIYENEELIK